MLYPSELRGHADYNALTLPYPPLQLPLTPRDRYRFSLSSTQVEVSKEEGRVEGERSTLSRG